MYLLCLWASCQMCRKVQEGAEVVVQRCGSFESKQNPFIAKTKELNILPSGGTGCTWSLCAYGRSVHIHRNLDPGWTRTLYLTRQLQRQRAPSKDFRHHYSSTRLLLRADLSPKRRTSVRWTHLLWKTKRSTHTSSYYGTWRLRNHNALWKLLKTKTKHHSRQTSVLTEETATRNALTGLFNDTSRFKTFTHSSGRKIRILDPQQYTKAELENLRRMHEGRQSERTVPKVTEIPREERTVAINAIAKLMTSPWVRQGLQSQQQPFQTPQIQQHPVQQQFVQPVQMAVSDLL